MKLVKKWLAVACIICSCSSSISAQKQFKAVLVTATRGWQHASGHYGVEALKQLADRNNFDLIIQEDPGLINDKFLASVHVVIFLNTTGNIFDSAQQKAFERFIQSGKGYVGIHAAADTEYDWAWYTQLVGRMFVSHPMIQTTRLQVIDDNFPGMKTFKTGQLWTDEWYEYGPEKVTGLKYLMSIDEKSYNPKKPGSMGDTHGISWYHQFDGGRAFYTGLGHLPAIYSDQQFLDHIYGGIYWAALGKL
ncbi:MAG: ThuA domain-containing protein [Bacteroidota bacterium]